MSKEATRNHFIMLGRVSQPIADAILAQYAGITNLRIDTANNVFQSEMGSFPDGEPSTNLFLNGKSDKYPVEQNLSEADKRDIEKQLNGAHVTIVHSISGENASGRQIGLLGMLDELKNHYRVGTITVIAPYLPMRNDKRFKTLVTDERGEMEYVSKRNAPLTRSMVKLMRLSGADRIISFSPHSREAVAHFREFFSHDAALKPAIRFVDASTTMISPFLEKYLARISGEWEIAVGAPDGLNKPNDLAVNRARHFGVALHGNEHSGQKDIREIPWMYGIHKQRISPTETKVIEFSGNVDGRDAAIVDDIYSSGQTTINAAKLLREHGAKAVFSFAVHGVLPNGALERLVNNDDITVVYVTDSIPSVPEKIDELGLRLNTRIHLVTLAPLVIKQIEWDIKHSATTTGPRLEKPYAIERQGNMNGISDTTPGL
jgi:phosphoribosylpyrophosphate synthetase